MFGACLAVGKAERAARINLQFCFVKRLFVWDTDISEYNNILNTNTKTFPSGSHLPRYIQKTRLNKNFASCTIVWKKSNTLVQTNELLLQKPDAAGWEGASAEHNIYPVLKLMGDRRTAVPISRKVRMFDRKASEYPKQFVKVGDKVFGHDWIHPPHNDELFEIKERRWETASRVV